MQDLGWPDRDIKRYLFLLITVLFLFNELTAQDSQTELGLSSAFYASTDTQLPFWFVSNVQGKVEAEDTNFINEFFFNKTLVENNFYQLDLGGNAVSRFSNRKTFFFSELYLKGRAGSFQLDVGRFPQPIGLTNHDLSVGSMMFSDNATPVPKISLSTPQFTDIFFTDGKLQFKGMFSHGWFEEDRHISNSYLHQKFFYLRANVGSFSATGGAVHNVMWGGYDLQYGKLPQSFNDFLRVVTGSGAKESSNVPYGEQWNVMGNSIAAYEFDLLYKAEKFDLSLNRLFYLEDKVSTRFRSPWDGVWSANLIIHDNNRPLSAFIYEHFNTKQQDSLPHEPLGRQSYYNHFFYHSGWSYENRVLGIPTIIYDEDNERVVDNIMVGHHIGVSGSLLENLNYKMFFTFVRHYGTVDDRTENGVEVIPIDQMRRDQYSWLLSIDYHVKQVEGMQTNLKLGSDFGEFYDHNLGVMLGISWNGIF